MDDDEIITLNETKFPYIIPLAEGETVYSLATVYTTEYGHMRDTLFIVPNPELRTSRNRGDDGSLFKRDQNILDSDRDAIRTFYLPLTSVSMDYAHGGSVSFYAWVQESEIFKLGFYPEGYGPEQYESYGEMPYLPPKVEIPGLTLPTMIGIRLSVGPHLHEWYEERKAKSS